MSRRDWLYPAIRDHVDHDLSVDNAGSLQCLSCLKTLTRREDPLVAHKRHRLTIVTGAGPEEEPWVETIRCVTCAADVVEAASFIYSVIVPER